MLWADLPGKFAFVQRCERVEPHGDLDEEGSSQRNSKSKDPGPEAPLVCSRKSKGTISLKWGVLKKSEFVGKKIKCSTLDVVTNRNYDELLVTESESRSVMSNSL